MLGKMDTDEPDCRSCQLKAGNFKGDLTRSYDKPLEERRYRNVVATLKSRDVKIKLDRRAFLRMMRGLSMAGTEAHLAAMNLAERSMPAPETYVGGRA
jgi:hypothetical protein